MDYLREIMEETEISSYISNYLPSFPHIKETFTKYIQSGKDVFIEDSNGITLLENWFNNSSDFISDSIEKNIVSNLLFDTNINFKNNTLKEKMLKLAYTHFAFVLDLERKTEEQKKHFISHFDLLATFKHNEYIDKKDESPGNTSWLHLFLSNDRFKPLITVAEQYHPDFLEGLKLKNYNNTTIAYRICLHITRLPCNEEIFEQYLNLLHTINKKVPELFENNHVEYGTPYDFTLKNIALEDDKLASQHEKILSFFLHRKLDSIVPTKSLTIKKKKV